MGKASLINKLSTDRSKWPIEARICEHIWILQKKLIECSIMQKYIDKDMTLHDVELYLNDVDKTGISQDVLNLKQEVFNYNTINPIPNDSDKSYVHYFEVLKLLGTVLASKSPWWERYQQITGVMGVECILSIKTAESLFKRDPYAGDIKTILTKLIGE